jgi:hypothetical protein
MRRKPGDQMSLWKNRPKCSPRHSFVKIMHNLNSLKSGPKMWAISVIFSVCPKLTIDQWANFRPIWSRWSGRAVESSWKEKFPFQACLGPTGGSLIKFGSVNNGRVNRPSRGKSLQKFVDF